MRLPAGPRVRTGMRRLIALGLLAPALARADPPRLEGAAGARFGSMMVDGKQVGTVVPGHLDLGMRWQRWLGYAEYDLNALTYPLAQAPQGTAAALAATGDGKGLMHRLGANARYAFGRVGDYDRADPGGAELWAELGAGVEYYVWDAGGTWTRPDLALGLGLTSYGSDDGLHGGLTLGLRVQLARRNDVAHAPAACGGPCDGPTQPTGWDRSFLFDLTVLFGR